MKPEELQGYALQALQPLALACAIEFAFETGAIFYLILACLAFWGVYFAYQMYAATGKAFYEPIVAELEGKLEERNTAFSKLDSDFHKFIDYAEKEIQNKNEGIASLLKNDKDKEGEIGKLRDRIKLLESGKELTDAKWEVSRLQEELTNQRASFERQLTQANEKLTQANNDSEGKILELREKLTQAQRDRDTLQKEVTRLLPYERKANELEREKEIRRLRTSFSQALNGSGDEKILEVSKSLEKLGVSPADFCDTAERKARYEQALNSLKTDLVA